MKFSERLAALNRLQRTTAFKVIASCVVGVLALGAVIAYAVHLGAIETPAITLQGDAPTETEGRAGIDTSGDREGSAAKRVDQDAEQQAAAQAREAGEAWVRFFNDLAGSRFSLGSFALGVGLLTACALAVIWLGLGLTYLGVLMIAGVTALPLILWGRGGWQSAGFFMAGGLALAASFSALVQGLRAALSWSHPVTSIASNLVAEAVRMNLSLVFIVLLIIGLAALPGLLNEDTPLRYRIQTFLQWGTSLSYLVTAVLVLFLAVGSVAGEQRDKIIWQTMTKPVKAWQYILGKWLGVVGVAAVLLSVTGTGIFLFTEYLRNQRAQGEVAPFVEQSGRPGAVSADRLALESQVLVARVTERPKIPDDQAERVDAAVRERIQIAQQLFERDPATNDPPDPGKIAREAEKDLLQQFFSVEPGRDRVFRFVELRGAKAVNRPLTLRYKVNAGGNMPDQIYRISLLVPGSVPIVRQVFLDQFVSMPLHMSAITVLDQDEAVRRLKAMGLPEYLAGDSELLRREAALRTGLTPEQRAQLIDLADEMSGVLDLAVFNGDVRRQTVNPETMTFPPGGLEISYPISSWQANYFRVMTVMLMKLAFLAIIAIAAATFLSFPVAAIVAFGIFMMAEGSTFMARALESYGYTDDKNNIIWWQWVVTMIAETVTGAFRWYGNLKTTESLVDGRLFGWGDVTRATLLLSLGCAVMFTIGAVIFRRRELAIYSGQ